jgi:hypothetical protein
VPGSQKPGLPNALLCALAVVTMRDQHVFGGRRQARNQPAEEKGSCESSSELGSNKVAASPPASWAAMKRGTSAGRMPANVSLSDLAIVTAGLAKDVDAVNQYAAAM